MFRGAARARERHAPQQSRCSRSAARNAPYNALAELSVQRAEEAGRCLERVEHNNRIAESVFVRDGVDREHVDEDGREPARFEVRDGAARSAGHVDNRCVQTLVEEGDGLGKHVLRGARGERYRSALRHFVHDEHDVVNDGARRRFDSGLVGARGLEAAPASAAARSLPTVVGSSVRSSLSRGAGRTQGRVSSSLASLRGRAAARCVECRARRSEGALSGVAEERLLKQEVLRDERLERNVERPNALLRRQRHRGVALRDEVEVAVAHLAEQRRFVEERVNDGGVELLFGGRRRATAPLGVLRHCNAPCVVHAPHPRPERAVLEEELQSAGDGDAGADVDRAAQRLLGRLVEAERGDLAHRVRRLVQHARDCGEIRPRRADRRRRLLVVRRRRRRDGRSARPSEY